MKIKRKTFERIKTFFIVTLLIGGAWGIYHLYYKTDVFTIYAYRIEGDGGEHATEIEQLLLENVEGYRHFFIPNNKILTYPQHEIVEMVSAVIPDAKEITMKPTSLHSIGITITEFVPLFKYTETQAITEEGIIFPTRKNITSLPTLIVQSTTTDNVDIQDVTYQRLRLDKDLLLAIKDLESKISKVIFRVDIITLTNDGDIYFENTETKARVIASRQINFKKGWSNLVSAIDTDPLKSKLAQEKNHLEYLDIRFGNKVFYKFLHETAAGDPAIINDHATSTATTTSQ